MAEADLESGKKIVGFASLSPYRDRPGYRTSVENSVYVHRDHYRKGVGSLLLGAIIEQARAHGFHAIFARIAGAQPASIDPARTARLLPSRSRTRSRSQVQPMARRRPPWNSSCRSIRLRRTSSFLAPLQNIAETATPKCKKNSRRLFFKQPEGLPWAGKDLNLRRRCRRIYSPLPLATRAPTQEHMRLAPGLELPV